MGFQDVNCQGMVDMTFVYKVVAQSLFLPDGIRGIGLDVMLRVTSSH